MHPVAQQERVAGYLLTLLPEERRQLEKNALASGDSFLRNRLQQLERDGDDQMASVYRDKLVSDHVQSLLSTD